MTGLYDVEKPDEADLPADVPDQQRMRSLIESLSAYIEHYHGGRVEMVDSDGITLQVRMRGACRGCNLAPVTLHGWIAGTVKPFFPELKEVVAV